MKKIYFVLICFVAVVLLNATPQSQTMSNCEKYEQYCEDEDNLPRGNYYLLQPGLFSIANQMPKKYGGMLHKVYRDGDSIGAYPWLLHAYVLKKNFSNIDTFRFNWHCDTILCTNYSRDSNGTFKHKCDLVSSIDSVKVYDIDYDPYFIHGFHMDNRYKDTYMRAIRHWDKKLLDEIFLPDTCYWTRERLTISRFVIKNGKLTDVKSMCSYGVREPYSIIPKI